MIGGAKGIGIGIDFGIPNQYCRATSKPYIEKDVLDSLRVVASAYGKSNNDADRSIVKNLVDPDNPFVISNAAFKLNSGFGKYEEDFDSWIPNYNVATLTYTPSKLHITSVVNGNGISYTRKATNAMKVEVTGMQSLDLIYRYITGDDTWGTFRFDGDGIYELPASGTTTKTYYTGFSVLNYKGDCDITIEQIPSFEGAFVTDGINDLITSTKTVQEMLGGSNEITVVSMIHKLSLDNNWTNLIGELKGDHTFVANRGINTDKTGIYGYSYNYNENAIVINNILGDKNDYIVRTSTSLGLDNKYYVTGFRSADIIQNVSQLAWYWTIIANKVLTTDEINQVIAYYNLDRTLNPDILCNVKKQGITNENHAEFGDKLIDFSGNGRDIQLNNIAWKGDSGIGKYETDFTTWTRSHFTDEVNFTPSKIEVTGILTTNSILINNKPTPIYNVEIHSPNKSIVVYYQYNDDTGVKRIALVDGINELPSANDSLFVTSDRLNSKGITITQIPSHAGALCLDGVNDFGKVTGMPTYKDYTVVADYERLKINIGVDSDSPILSKSESVKLGAFIFNTISSNGDKVSYSFGRRNIINTDDTIRKIFYQSKYINDGQDINIESTFVDSDKLWLGTDRDSDYRFIAAAIYSLMSFPYSMSEFLIERQLKKHKLGTLYPDMVEFRPVIKTNVDYTLIQFYINNYTKRIYPGDYIPINTPIQVNFYLKNNVDELISFKVNGNDSTFKRSTVVDNAYNIVTLPITESPQKIDITIDEYIRFEDIVQPYPVIFQITDRNTNQRYSWGDKIKVGSSIRLSQGEKTNLLSGLYSIQSYEYEGETYSYNQLTNLNIILTKQSISLSCNKIWLLDNNEPKCILSPRLLRIPNSSYKILGHIPDISGHGNNGKINNSAYAEGSGVNEDGSYQFDGVDDFVTIPTLSSGGKQVLMKVNWNSLNYVLYDQRNNAEAPFCIVTASGTIAYNQKNVGGNTYIDGILNNHILVDDLQAITHNIVLNNDYNVANSNSFIGTNYTKSIYAKMSLYDFMLFDEISTDDKIKELNEYVGIEGNVWRILTQLSNSTLISNETLIKNE